MTDYIAKIVKAWDPQGEMVKVSVSSTAQLADFVASVGKAVGQEGLQRLKYIDEDGDKILLATQESLNLCFREFVEKKRFKVVVDREDVLTHDQMVSNVLEEYREYLDDRSRFHFGYPYNLHYDHQEIFDCMKYSINNLGDPFVESNYSVHSRKFELDVLAFFADLWKIPEDKYWGYVTACGTEGNLHSILCAREMHPEGILYASEDSHYSVFKACSYYKIEYRKIRATSTGEMDYEHFKEELSKNTHRHAILVANIGTTVKGAVDSVDAQVEVMTGLGLTRDKWFIHCDGALYALMLPFMKEFEQVDFTKQIDSMCVSGHKFLGCPMPCGVVICRKENLDNVTQEIEYLNSVDTTIMGSRNGHAPIFLWYSLQKGGLESLNQKVKKCHANARLLTTMLRDRGVEAMLNERSTTVVLTRPPEPFVKHWQLACQGDIAHVVVMPNVTVEKIIQFVDEIADAVKGTWSPYNYNTENPIALSDSPRAFDHSQSFNELSFKSSRKAQQKGRQHGTASAYAKLNETFNTNPTVTKSPQPTARASFPVNEPPLDAL
eukprot:Rhum_TRINITY_DN5137_c0_g1::Rhum_TRINITY_DN5137_c0_g1_i1::g.16518::m.16518/K01590/hdc, HDC; histidine decarboxylase